MADRDIERAADQSSTVNPTPVYYQWPPTGDNPPTTPASGRGDATIDPAVMSAAVEVATARLRELGWTIGADLVEDDDIRSALEAAAGVLVPATAEHIAASIADASEEEPLSARFVAGMDYARLIAHRFAAGLPAGAAATGGHSDG